MSIKYYFNVTVINFFSNYVLKKKPAIKLNVVICLKGRLKFEGTCIKVSISEI